jgi:hypothetical protein
VEIHTGTSAVFEPEKRDLLELEIDKFRNSKRF